MIVLILVLVEALVILIFDSLTIAYFNRRLFNVTIYTQYIYKRILHIREKFLKNYKD